VINIC